MDDEKKIRMAAIAGASKALRYKVEHKRATDEEAIQHVTREMEEIIANIDKEE